MIFHVIFAATVLGAVFHLWFTRSVGLSSPRIVEVSLLYIICVQWGFGAALTSIPHIIVPDQIAEFIGWEAGSPFQVELGFASLGTAMLGIISVWHRGWFWLAPIMARSTFLLGAAYVHIDDILAHNNMSPGNAGPVLFYDIIIPILAISLFVVYWRQGGLESKA